MTREISYLFQWTFWFSCSNFLIPSGITSAHDQVDFDVPATCSAVVKQLHSDGQKTVNIIIPVSLNLEAESKSTIQEFQIEVMWHHGAFQITDYQPRTEMQSSIVGTIKVEDRKDASTTLGLDLSSGYFDAVGAKAGFQAGQQNGKLRRYEETPEHAVLVTSGTIQRGTGVNFCFKPSRISTLRGSRELSIACRVPGNWRGGVLMVKCRATGTRKFLGAFDDGFRHGAAFVVPVFISGDAQARDVASEFVRTEQRLRSDWRYYQQTAHSSSIGRHWSAVAGRPTQRPPEIWVHQLIQAGNDDWLEKYRQQLPTYITSSATKYVEARRELVNIGR